MRSLVVELLSGAMGFWASSLGLCQIGAVTRVCSLTWFCVGLSVALRMEHFEDTVRSVAAAGFASE